MKWICNYPNCFAITTAGHYCPEHKPKARPRTASQSEQMTERHKIYRTARWCRLSKLHRQQFPICEVCEHNLARDVDHWLEISIDEDQEHVFDPANHVSLCKSCHLEKGNIIKSLIKKGSINEIRKYLSANHPRQDESDYLERCGIQI